jgi:Tfp pilus assembly protein PilF
MRRSIQVVLLVLLVVTSAPGAEGPEDQYVNIYSLIQEADALNDGGQVRQAVAKYAEAQAALAKLPAQFPGWNENLVRFRLNYVNAKMAPLLALLPSPTNQVTAPHPPGPGPLPVPPAVETNSLVRQLQEEMTRLHADNATLSAKLKEALSVQPSAVDPREITRAEEKNRALLKENELLKVTLRQEQSSQSSRVDPQVLAEATRALADTRSKLETQERTLGTLQAENELLKKQAASTAGKPATADPRRDRELQQTRDKLVALQTQHDQLRSEKVVMEGRVKDLESGLAKANAVAAEAAKAETRKLKQLQEELDQQTAAARAAATANQERLARVEKERAQLAQEKADLETRLAKAPAGSSKADAQKIKQLETQLDDQMTAARAAARESLQRLSQLEKDKAQLAKEKTDLEGRLAKATASPAGLSKDDAQKLKQLQGEMARQAEVSKVALQESQARGDRFERELARLTKEKFTLEDRLAKVPPSAVGGSTVDARKLKKLQEDMDKQAEVARKTARDNEAKIQELEKELAQLAKVKTALESRLTANSTQATKTELARQKELEDQVASLRAKLEKTEQQLSRRAASRGASGDVRQQLEILKARLEVLEAKPEPYTREELAILRAPASRLVASASQSNSDSSPAVPATATNVTATNAVPDKKPARIKRTATTLPPGAGALDAAAQRAFAAGHFDEAEKKFLEVLRQDEKNIYVLGNLASTEVEMNKLDEAEKHLATALQLDPEDDYCLYLKGRVSYKRGKLDEALDLFGQAAKANPESAETQNHLGMVLAEKGLRAPAEAAFRKAIQLQPGYGSAHGNLAFVYATQKPPSLALARWHYQKALSARAPRNPELEKILGP